MFVKLPAATLRLPLALLLSTALSLNLALPAPAHADITATAESTSLSSTDTLTTTNLPTAESLLTPYEKALQELTDLKADAVTLKVKLNTGDTSVTQAQYNSLIQTIATKQAEFDALYAKETANPYYTTATTSLPTTGGINTSGNTGNLGSSSGGAGGAGSSGSGGGGGGIGKTLANAAMGGAIQGAMSAIFGGMQGTGAAALPGAGRVAPAMADEPAETATTDEPAAEGEEGANCGGEDTPKPKSATGGIGSDAAAARTGTAGGIGSDAAATARTAKPAAAAASAKCKSVDYSVKDPESSGKQIKTAGAKGNGKAGKIKSLAEADAFFKANKGSCIWGSNSSAGNKCECASLAKELGGLGKASGWKTGARATPDMAPGAIATMDAGGYCAPGARGGRHGCHAAYFVGRQNGQNLVLEQWNTSDGIRYSIWPDSKLAGYNRIISGQQTSLFHPFLEAPLWMVLNLSPQPLGMGLLKS